MRTASAHSSKRGGTKGYTLQMLPKEGTAIRRAYDALKASPAYPIFIEGTPVQRGTIITQLRDFYGLDIRPYPEKRTSVKGAAYKRYWLVGEWFGTTYVDYVADRRAKEERESRR